MISFFQKILHATDQEGSLQETVVLNLRQARFSSGNSPIIHLYSSFLLNQLISSLPVMLAGMKNLPVGNPLCRYAFLKSHVQTPSIHGVISK